MRPSHRVSLALGLGALLLAGARPAHAQGWIEPVPHRGGPVLRVGSEVEVTLDGRIARVSVTEQFRNTGPGLAEGSYLYPLSRDAVLQDVVLRAGKQELHGEVMAADDARAIYEEIVRRRRDPALLTLEGAGLIRARIFPIGPGETRTITLHYTQLVPRDGDALHFRHLLAGQERLADSAAVHVVVNQADLYGTPYSPTNPLTSRRRDGRLDITLGVAGARSAELFLPLRRTGLATSLLTHASGTEDGFFLLLIAPPPVTARALPRDLTLVVDVSGSMSGSKLEQAKAALREALNGLQPQDRFQIIAFSSAAQRFRAEAVPATASEVRAALEFVDGLVAGGGTNIEEALGQALTGVSETGRVPLVVFLTDGLPSVGERAPDRLAEAAAARIGSRRIFPVGLGQDVNTYLLDRLATEGRGTPVYLAPDGDVEAGLGSLFAKLRHPALTDLRIVSSPAQLSDLAPARLPDLFYGEELAILGRYRSTGRGEVVLEGKRNGRTERFSVVADFPATRSGNEFIPRLWAFRRIGELTRQIRLEGAPAGLIQQVRDLGLRYGILTEYTAYLVQEPGSPDAPPPAVARRIEAASVPAAQTGAAAFENAKASADLSASSNVAAAERVARQRMEALAPPRPAGGEIRRAGGRIFRRTQQGWRDLAHADSLTVTTVAAYSPAYFALVRALPELAPYLTVGDTLIVGGRRASVGVAPHGVTDWRPGQLDALVRAFRGA